MAGKPATAVGAGTRVFVTGANGKVGLPLVRALVERGADVVGLARDEAKASAVRDTGAACVVGSLGDTASLREGAAGAEVVFHLAGGVRGPGQTTPDVINHQGTRSLIEALGGGEGLRTLVFTSSVAVYGDRSSLWLTEDLPTRPNTRYGASKVAAEDALLESGLPVRIVRLAAVYGPGFPIMMAERMAAEKGWLPGEGRNYLPTIHVDDAVGGLLAVADRGQDGEVYNLADLEAVSMKDFYKAVHGYSGGREMRFWSTWVPSYVQFAIARNNERLQSKLGRRPLFTPDNLRLFTASARLKVDRVAKELEYEWKHPTIETGLAATFSGG